MAMPTPSEPLPPPDTKVRLPGEAEAEPVRPDEVRRRNLRDLGMLGLGIVSLAIVAYDFLYRDVLAPAQLATLELVDLGIVLVFVVEYVARLRKADRKLRFVAQNWFDLLGMVPLMATNIPLFRAFRLLRIGMIASRLLRMWSFFTGEKSAQLVFNRYRDALVEEVTDQVMLRAIAMTEDIVARGTYARALGESLAARREDLARMALESSKANELGRWFAVVPGFDAAVRQAALAAVDTVSAALRSDEMQRTFESTVRSLTAELREEVARKAWREARPRAGLPPALARQAAPRPSAGPS